MAHNDEFDELKVHSEPDEPEDVIRQMELDDLENIVDGWAADPHGHESHTDVYLTADDINGDETVNTAPSPHNNDHHAEPYATQSSVDSLQTDVSGKVDDPHDNAAHSVDYATNPHGDGSHTENYAVDGDPQPPEAHDNTAHSEDYLTEGSLAGVQTDIDGKADDPHDNTAHSEDYAVNGDAQPPEGHDNTAHTETYLTETDVSGKADAQGGRIGDETPLESLHTEDVETEQVTYRKDPQTAVAGVGPTDYTDEYTDYNRGLRINPNYDRELRITEVTINTDSSGDVPIGLWEFDGDAGRGTQIDSTTVSANGGIQTVSVDLLIPGSGDYYLGCDVAAGGVPQLSVFVGVDDIFPVESDLLTVVEGASPEAYVGPRSNYYFFFDIGVEEASATTSSTSLTESGAVSFEYLESARHNDVIYAKPGELVETVESAGSESVVKMIPENDYTPGEEIVMPEGVTLDFNGARIAPETDHNIFLLSEECTIKNGKIIVGYGYEFTSTVFLADTGRYGDSYHGASQAISIDAVCANVNDYHTGKGLYVNVANDSEWFSVQQDINLKIAGFNDGVHFHVADNGHANGNRLECHLWNCAVNIRKTGGGNCSTRITGEMDGTDSGPDNGTQYLYYSDNDSGRPITFYGYLWDSFNAEQEPIHGQINIVAHNRPHPTLLPQSPNAAGLIQWIDSDEIGYADLTSQIAYRMRFNASWWRFEVDTDGGRNFRDMMSFRPLDNIVRINGELMVGSINEVG